VIRVRWTSGAAVHFERLVERIRAENPAAAHRTARTIYQAVELLEIFPMRGRAGRVTGTRELVIPGLPYIVVYTIAKGTVHVLRIRHGAQHYD
jgi:addiction module RelE/StbE family toxin